MTDLRIGILGAPGSGKTVFAQKLATALRTQRGESKRQTVRVVDGYVKNLQKKTGYAFDIFGTYPQNYQILFERWTREQEAEHAGCEILISVGSIYESILYTALRVNSDIVLKEDSTVQLQGRAAMEMLGVTQSLIAAHDLLLFLPYDGKTLAEKGRSYDVAINEKLPGVVAGYFRPVTELTGTTKRKVDNALQAVQAVERAKAALAAQNQQPAV